MIEDLVGVTARLDMLKANDACTTLACTPPVTIKDTRLYLGVEGGSWAGLAGFAAGGVFMALIIIAFANNY
jgi:hypothetical protein